MALTDTAVRNTKPAGKPRKLAKAAGAERGRSHRPGMVGAPCANKIIRHVERDVFPWIGVRPIGDIDAPGPLAVARRI